MIVYFVIIYVSIFLKKILYYVHLLIESNLERLIDLVYEIGLKWLKY